MKIQKDCIEKLDFLRTDVLKAVEEYKSAFVTLCKKAGIDIPTYTLDTAQAYKKFGQDISYNIFTKFGANSAQYKLVLNIISQYSNKLHALTVLDKNSDILNPVKPNKVLLKKKKYVSPYLKVSWAPKGLIDLNNLNGVDFVIVPCAAKCPLLFVTDGNLLQQRKRVQLKKLLDANYLPTDEYFKYFNIAFYNICERRAEYNTFTKIFSPLEKNIEMPIDNVDNSNIIGVTNIGKLKKFSNAPALFLTQRSEHQILFDDSLAFLLGLSGQIQHSDLRLFHNILVEFTPKIVVRNPFLSNIGGIIPIQNGKLCIEQAMPAINMRFELITDKQIIEFDEIGDLKNVMAPSKKCYYVRRGASRNTYFYGIRRLNNIINKDAPLRKGRFYFKSIEKVLDSKENLNFLRKCPPRRIVNSGRFSVFVREGFYNPFSTFRINRHKNNLYACKLLNFGELAGNKRKLYKLI